MKATSSPVAFVLRDDGCVFLDSILRVYCCLAVADILGVTAGTAGDYIMALMICAATEGTIALPARRS